MWDNGKRHVEGRAAQEAWTAAQAREQADAGRAFVAGYRAWVARLPQASELVEHGVERALEQLRADGHLDTDPARPKALTLARKWAKPGEIVLAVHYNPRYPGSPEEVAIAFTHGYAIRKRGGNYRSEFQLGTDGRRLKDSAETFPGSWSLHQGLHDHERSWEFARVCQSEVARGERTVGTPPVAARRGRALPRPKPRLLRSARDAELAVAEWMTYLRFATVQVTPVGADAGVDVFSATALAQVKAETVATGRPPLQQHHGVCTAAGKQALFFSLAGFTVPAQRFADSVGMALFTFNLAAEVVPVNEAAMGVFARAGVKAPQL